MSRTENISYSLRQRTSKGPKLNTNNNAKVFYEGEPLDSISPLKKLIELWSYYKNISQSDNFKPSLFISLIIFLFGIFFSYKTEYNKSQYSIDDVKLLIKEALYKYNADKTGLPDYALETTGASILKNRCSKSLPYELNTPNLAIQPNVLPGNCWAFEGSKGVLAIKLAREIIPTSISIEHIPESISLTGIIDSALKDFKVIAYQNEYSTEGMTIGEYTYNAKSHDYIQNFPTQMKPNSAISVIELVILSNHGNELYTCIYRIRVHGLLKA